MKTGGPEVILSSVCHPTFPVASRALPGLLRGTYLSEFGTTETKGKYPNFKVQMADTKKRQIRKGLPLPKERTPNCFWQMRHLPGPCPVVPVRGKELEMNDTGGYPISGDGV